VPALVIERNAATTSGRTSAVARVVRRALIDDTPSGPPRPKTNMTTTASGTSGAATSSQIGADITASASPASHGTSPRPIRRG
jgi:hypothetical protein